MARLLMPYTATVEACFYCDFSTTKNFLKKEFQIKLTIFEKSIFWGEGGENAFTLEHPTNENIEMQI